MLEKSLSPTIVCKEKKAYGVFTPFDRKRDQYRIAQHELQVQSKQYIQSQDAKLKVAVKRNQELYNKVPRVLRQSDMGTVQNQFLQTRKNVFVRNLQTQMLTKKQFEWTTQKMIDQNRQRIAEAKAKRDSLLKMQEQQKKMKQMPAPEPEK